MPKGKGTYGKKVGRPKKRKRKRKTTVYSKSRTRGRGQAGRSSQMTQ